MGTAVFGVDPGHGGVGSLDGEAALQIFAVEALGRSDHQFNLIAVVDARIAGQLAVVEQQHRRQGGHLEGLLAAGDAGHLAEVGRDLVGRIVGQGFLRDDAEGLRIHDLHVEIDLRRHADGLFGNFKRLVAVFQRKGVKEADGHRIIDPDLLGVAGDTVAGGTAAAAGRSEQQQRETQDKCDSFHSYYMFDSSLQKHLLLENNDRPAVRSEGYGANRQTIRFHRGSKSESARCPIRTQDCYHSN